MWIVKREFADMADGGYVYREGERYPRYGAQASQDRLRELSSCSNRLCMPLVEKAEEKPPVKPKRSRKKKAE